MSRIRIICLVVASVIIVWLLGVVSCASGFLVSGFVQRFFPNEVSGIDVQIQAPVFWCGILVFLAMWIMLTRISLRRLWRGKKRSDFD